MVGCLLQATDIPVNVLVFVLALILVAGVGSYGLYLGLLRTLVEYGEWHPANLRRFMLWLFFALSALSSGLLLESYLRPIAYWALAGFVVVFGLILLFTRKRV